MKKTLIASAIAAATFSGSVLAMESAAELAARMDSMPSVYGNIQYAIAHDAVDGGSSELSHFDNGSTIGFKHDHEIVPGLTGFLKIEFDGINADDKSYGRGQIRLDEAYIGVKGDSFGQLWVGSDDSMYESTIDQIVNFYEVAALNIGGSYSTGEGDLIQYKTPSFGGLTLGASLQINGDGDDQQPDDKSYPYQLAAMYSLGDLDLAVAMDSNDGNTGYSSTGLDINNENTYGVRAAYSLDNLTFSGEYQTRKDVGDLIGVQGVIALGANQFALSYEMATADDASDTEVTTITAQALHNLSDNMYVYFEGYLGGGDDGVYGVAGKSERSVASVGGVYYF
ncbi:porin [Marinobacter caseinilyticus]|uniref:porin n=1 Tax=Marinobacter caseinilyticus TaxID=2692195 RepID=UPI0014073763|nr:porin [Marinobacter caseinilyticus]